MRRATAAEAKGRDTVVRMRLMGEHLSDEWRARWKNKNLNKRSDLPFIIFLFRGWATEWLHWTQYKDSLRAVHHHSWPRSDYSFMLHVWTQLIDHSFYMVCSRIGHLIVKNELSSTFSIQSATSSTSASSSRRSIRRFYSNPSTSTSTSTSSTSTTSPPQSQFYYQP